jgi:hypothetical protein
MLPLRSIMAAIQSTAERICEVVPAMSAERQNNRLKSCEKNCAIVEPPPQYSHWHAR